MSVIWATEQADYFDWGSAYGQGAVVLDDVVAPRVAWSGVVKRGQVLTIVDVGGNQSADFLCFDALDTTQRYSVQDTLAAQRHAYLVEGSILMSNEAHPMMTVIGSEIDRHDTIGGACSKESNTLRYGHHTLFHHACRENFLIEGSRYGLGPRDVVSNINWFMNVPVEADGTLGIVDGMSAPGKRVALRAEMDVLVIISNCPQVNNPCNDFNPTPLRVLVTERVG